MAKKDQNTPTVLFKKLNPDAVVPARLSDGAAGFDLVSVEEVRLQTMERAIVSTGLALAVPEGYEAQVRPRSGLAAKNGITVLNSPGTIDADYRGEVKVILINFGPVFTVAKGDRIAQLVVQRVPSLKFEEAETLPDTSRGSGGFGSTGR